MWAHFTCARMNRNICSFPSSLVTKESLQGGLKLFLIWASIYLADQSCYDLSRDRSAWSGVNVKRHFKSGVYSNECE